MTPTTARLAFAFALLGLGASLTATYTHYQLLANPGYLSFCDVSATISCSQVYSSRFGSVAGVPVALFGAIFFVFALLLAVAALMASREVQESVAGYLFAASTIGLSVVIYLGYASFAVLHQVCLVCLTTYAAVIGLFLVSGAASSIPMLSLPRRVASDLRKLAASPLALALAALFVGGAATTLAFFPREASSVVAGTEAAAPADAEAQQNAQFEQWYNAQLRVPLVVPTEGAKVLVVKFNDYQCPACRITFDGYRQILPKYIASGQVKYVTKHYPLEPECNPHVPGGNHYASCEAAASVLMAKAKGTSDKLEEWIFSHIGPPALTPAQVKDAARTVGGITDFDAQYARAKEEIKTDAGLGQLLGVKSTPTFYINGRTPTQILPPQYFEVLIQLELQRTK
jgi:vitamin-K-epoxide reductase (warfarin-sensitive)